MLTVNIVHSGQNFIYEIECRDEYVASNISPLRSDLVDTRLMRVVVR